MTRLALPLLLCFPAVALAEQRFPLPEFTTGHTPPATTTPPPQAEWIAYLDVALLALALALAAYFVLRLRSRRAVFVLMILALAYFGFYRHGCVCPIGSLQNVAQAIAMPGVALPLTVAAFFLLPLLFALFAGRVFCAAVCPLGAAQDVMLVRPARVPAWLEHALGLIPYLYLGAAVLFATLGSLYLICAYDPFVAFFRLDGSAAMLIAGVVMLGISTVVGRPYCRFLCPYSVLLRWLAPLSRWQVAITPERCVNCHLCKDACPFGAITPPSPERPLPRRAGKGLLVALLLLLPVLALLGGRLGSLAAPALSRVDPTVRKAELMWRAEQNEPADLLPDMVTAFNRSGERPRDLFVRAAAIQGQYRAGAFWLGVWLGLVIGGKLIFLSIRRRRTEYVADPARCLGCGRCYQSCPLEHERLKALSETDGTKALT